MIRLLLIIIMVTQLGCTIVLETAVGSLIGNIGAEIIKQEFNKEDDEAPNVPADGTLGIDSDDNIYILKP